MLGRLIPKAWLVGLAITAAAGFMVTFYVKVDRAATARVELSVEREVAAEHERQIAVSAQALEAERAVTAAREVENQGLAGKVRQLEAIVAAGDDGDRFRLKSIEDVEAINAID